jgi:hypothetical protein
MKSTSVLLFATLASAKATVYLIRHGEKPSSGNGLSLQGRERAQCLRTIFGVASQYDIGHIMAQTPQSDGSQQRPYDTVEPLATDLDLTVDTSCERDNSGCVAEVVKNYTSSGNILICWKHTQLNTIAEALGASDVSQYPSGSYNLIWTDPYPYSEITSVTSENCPGLDK